MSMLNHRPQFSTTFCYIFDDDNANHFASRKYIFLLTNKTEMTLIQRFRTGRRQPWKKSNFYYVLQQVTCNI